MRSFIMALGITAGVCTTISIVPQIVKTYRTRHTEDLSLGMFVILALGVALWCIYGVLIGELPIIIANAVTFVLVMYVVIMKIRHG